MIYYRNHEGYPSPTEGEAIANIMREYRREQKRKYRDKNRRKIYVASKYAGDVKANTEAAVMYCRKVIRDGYMPVASHLLYPQILDDNDPAQRELGLLFGLALLKLCEEVWVFGEISKGVAQEIDEAKKLGIPIRFFEEGEA